MFHRAPHPLLAPLLGALALALPSTGCKNSKNLASAGLASPDASDAIGGERCSAAGGAAMPLLVEWPAADRASLEARMQSGPVVVRYADCKIEVLRECQPQGGYDYIGITRKNDAVVINNESELYANLPLSAVNLETSLARAGSLSVAMAIVGVYETPQVTAFSIHPPACREGTHLVSAAQVGAFEVHTGASAEIGAGVEVVGVAGAGGKSSADKEVLSRDGDPNACDGSQRGDAGPPNGCGGILRVELSPLPDPGAACPANSAWNGSSCQCAAGYTPNGTTCVAAAVATAPPPQPGTNASTPAPASTAVQPAASTTPAPTLDEEQTLCESACQRQFVCEAERQGLAVDEASFPASELSMCVGTCQVMTPAMMLPQLRLCVQQPTCEQFFTCIEGPDLDEDFEDDDFSTSPW